MSVRSLSFWKPIVVADAASSFGSKRSGARALSGVAVDVVSIAGVAVVGVREMTMGVGFGAPSWANVSRLEAAIAKTVSTKRILAGNQRFCTIMDFLRLLVWERP